MKNEFIVYDIETYYHCFIIVLFNVNTSKINIFEISDRKNQLSELKRFMKQYKTAYYVGFNNLEFDYPILYWLLLQNTTTSIDIYNKTQQVLNAENKWHVIIPTYKEIHKQIDLYKINHFDNDAKRTSLKALEIAMKMDNVEDLPYSVTKILNNSDIDNVISYCKHDVKATTLFLYECKNELRLRFDLSKEYDLNLLNHNDPKIGESIFIKFLSEKTGKTRKDFISTNTKRNFVNLSTCILDYITFNAIEFKLLLNWLKKQKVYYTKGFFNKLSPNKVSELLPYMNKKLVKGLIKNLNIIYKNLQYDIGTGGLHACIKPGVYIANSKEGIYDDDIKSYYPNIAITNEFYPEHLDKIFCTIYKMIYDNRTKIPKTDSRNYGLKIALNGCCGKSNEKNSPFYDTKFFLSVTLNGQLLLLKYIEMLVENIPNILILQANTDGVTYRCDRKYLKDVNRVKKDWENLTGLEWESAEYEKMIINNVNNYQALYSDGNIKLKGLFEINKPWHKNHSMLIIPIALKEYFINNIKIEDTIYNHTSIYDFCIRQKFNKGFQGELHHLGDDNKIKVEKTQKNTRYIISNNGKVFWKRKLETNTISTINANQKVTVLNKIDNNKNIKDYNINYNWYIKEANKIVEIIENKQLTLF